LSGVHFDAIVLDETSQLTLPAAAMAMLRGDRWFFFGDHKQLPPVSLVHRDNPADASVFARLARGSKPTTLNTTYRLNEPLTIWPSEIFYNGDLIAHERNASHRIALKKPPARYPALLAPDPSMVRIELDHEGCRSHSLEEADLAADLIADLFDSGLTPAQAGVVVPFRAQASAIRRLLRGDRLAKHPEAPDIVIDTVDRFQGQEREVIILSLACSDPAFIARLDAFLFLPPRLNVAVTRARTKVILLHSTVLRNYATTQAPCSESAAIFASLLEAATLLPA
jgi:DNA replication ATP-dependent helicase Dna2